MKRTKKIAALLLAAVLLVTTSVAVTVAYLTSTTEVVENTFTVGQVVIDLDEVQVDPYGVPSTYVEDEDGNKVWTADENAPRVKANEYKLVPGHTYVKDPTVHVAGDSENCFLFVEVVDGLKEIEAAKTIETQMLEKGWEKLSGNVWYWTADANATTVTAKPVSVAASANVVVFDDFTLKDNAAVESYKEASITIKAYAIQADGFEDKTPAQIWAAF